MWERITVLCGRAVAWWLALAGSTWGWMPYFTDWPYDVFLAATAVVALLIAACAK